MKRQREEIRESEDFKKAVRWFGERHYESIKEIEDILEKAIIENSYTVLSLAQACSVLREGHSGDYSLKNAIEAIVKLSYRGVNSAKAGEMLSHFLIIDSLK